MKRKSRSEGTKVLEQKASRPRPDAAQEKAAGSCRRNAREFDSPFVDGCHAVSSDSAALVRRVATELQAKNLVREGEGKEQGISGMAPLDIGVSGKS
jgi:hypothetical protein